MDKIGNCPFPGKDGNTVQCVGPWVENKYYFLERYLNASCEARRGFSDNNNSVYIDLFSGPGKSIIRGEGREILGGSMIAFTREEAPFNNYYLFDLSKQNIIAQSNRTSGKVICKAGDSNKLVIDLVRELEDKPYRYHFVFIDPFAPKDLKFSTIKELAKLKRMDMLIHFPIGPIKRNYKEWLSKQNTILDDFMGTDKWREKINNVESKEVLRILIGIYKEKLKKLGYPDEGLAVLSSKGGDASFDLPLIKIKNTKDSTLYLLILISKHKIGQKIWNSIIQYNPNGQKRLFI